MEENSWFTTEVEYDGYPLLLRKPNHPNIWSFQNNYTQIVRLSHSLDHVNSNGLPTADYNTSLSEFDGETIRLFDPKKEGIIFLIETFGGSRNYWFFTLPTADYSTKFKNLQERHKDKDLEVTSREDKNWNFIKDYPFRLYQK
ncbi:hypothetical protein GCM10023183_15450 [Nibribacter koreensis]|uniref:DUF695 domain-containing protein n=2 Tax=Nibribacter koreensis TaxID=1084519 RepID=A0ABP8FG98_9BACT